MSTRKVIKLHTRMKMKNDVHKADATKRRGFSRRECPDSENFVLRRAQEAVCWILREIRTNHQRLMTKFDFLTFDGN